MTRVSKLTKDAPKCAGSDYTDSRSRKVLSHTEAQSISTMKRSSDYGNQSHDNIKKARFGQGGYGGYSLSASGMRSDLSQASSTSDLYSHQFPPVGPSAMMMGNHSYSQGNPGFHHHHGHQGGHFAAMGTYQHATPQYAASIGQYTPTVNSMVPQFSSAFSNPQFPGYQQATVASVTNSTGRTVYLGNIPSEVPVDEILNQVKVGPIESVRILPDKSCAFISFMDGTAAAAFYHDASTRKIMIHGQDLKVGWGKPSPVPPQVQISVNAQNATRNVYLGNLDDSITESVLREDLGKFGTIDTVKIVREKNIGFVHFLSISTAMKAVQSLPQDPKYTNKKINYGKDRCAQRTTTSNGAASQYAFGGSLGFQTFGNVAFPSFDPYAAAASHLDSGSELRSPTSPLFSSASSAAGSTASASNAGNRTIYLGNIHPETICEEICNVIRGGILQQIRYMPDKHIAFVTFVDPNAANSFLYLATHQGIMIKNRRLKVGWGKPSGPLPGNIQMAVTTQNASRNVYVGQLDDSITEEKLRRDFSEFGEIELVNILKEKSCGFVNFTSILCAMKAIEGIKMKEEYKKFRINFGKDRCGNPPRGLTGGSSGGVNKANKGRNNGETDARVLHGGDTSEPDCRNVEGQEDEVAEVDDEYVSHE
jgi:RNA recognition motif-containing protein